MAGEFGDDARIVELIEFGITERPGRRRAKHRAGARAHPGGLCAGGADAEIPGRRGEPGQHQDPFRDRTRMQFSPLRFSCRGKRLSGWYPLPRWLLIIMLTSCRRGWTQLMSGTSSVG